LDAAGRVGMAGRGGDGRQESTGNTE